MSKKTLYLVIPCYNEEPALPETSQRLKEKMGTLVKDGRIADDSRIMFVDDGSKDKTWQIIEDLHNQNELFAGVKLAHNRGHQNALLAGLSKAYEKADITISLDADLQDDIDAIDQMLTEAENGAEIVFGVRSSRKKDRFFKRFTAQSFYKIMKRMGVETVYNHADYRLMTKNAVAALLQYQESNLFLRGIVPQLGYQTATVEYERQKRNAGESKYPFKKMLALALDGISSFSTKPLHILWWLGMFLCFVGFAGFVTTLVLMYTINLTMLYPLISAVGFFTGVLLMAMGVLGLYIGKIYIESKHRPRFVVEKVLDQKTAETK